jgi:addiction module HigA family antidote
MKTSKRLDPIHPGEILLEDFMKPLAISINQLARDLDVPPNRIGAIVNGIRSITAEYRTSVGNVFSRFARNMAWPPARLRSWPHTSARRGADSAVGANAACRVIG